LNIYLTYLQDKSKISYTYIDNQYEIIFPNLAKYLGRYSTKIQPNSTKKRKEKKRKENIKEPPANADIMHIVNYLNQKSGKNYRPTASKTVSVITSRLNESYTTQNFETVINRKCDEWLSTDMEKFLRPETLFGNKFEGYLNEGSVIMSDFELLKGALFCGDKYVES
jgi:uncharacterized phage protein (TIGR02220 family)